MTENKHITIYELLPLLKPGWVAMDKNGTWCWYSDKPDIATQDMWLPDGDSWLCVNLTNEPLKEIKTFNGDWKDSLMEVK